MVNFGKNQDWVTVILRLYRVYFIGIIGHLLHSLVSPLTAATPPPPSPPAPLIPPTLLLLKPDMGRHTPKTHTTYVLLKIDLGVWDYLDRDATSLLYPTVSVAILWILRYGFSTMSRNINQI